MYSELIFPLNSNDPVLLEIPVIITQGASERVRFPLDDLIYVKACQHLSLIHIFRRQIEHGGPVTVTHPDIIRYFMTIPEAVSLVLEAGAYAKNGQIFVLNMGDPVRIADLAKNMIRLSGYEPGVEIEIKYIGLRPGEKLYEELLMNEEGMQTTENSRIFIGRQIEFDETVFRKQLKELERAAENECPDICERVKRMVPEYQYEGEKKHDGPSYTYSAGG